ncbi:MAG: glycosyltransferase family 39 protein, partial [Anaerolineae bacterium]
MTKRYFPLIVVLLLAGFALRMLRLGDIPLSGDEAYSVITWLRLPADVRISEIAVATTEPHPPLALLLYNAWGSLVGDSLVAVRMIAVLPGMLALAAGYALTKQLAGQRAALVALGLLAGNPFLIDYGQFARNYGLWIGLSALTLLTMVHTWERRPQRYPHWLPYIGLAALTGYVFYLEAFMFVAHNLYALVRIAKQPRALPAWIGAQVTLAAVLAPWWLRPALFNNAQDYTPNGHPANPLWAVQAFLFGDTLPTPLQAAPISDPANIITIAALLALGILVAALLVVLGHKSLEDTVFLAALTLIPLLGLTLLTVITGRSYFDPRYIASAALPAIVLVGVAADQAIRQRPRIVWAAGAGAVALCGLSLWHYHTTPTFARGPDFPRVIELLNSQAEDDVLEFFNSTDPAFSYYYDRHYALPGELVTLPGRFQADYEETAPLVEAAVAGHERVWFVPVRGNPYDPAQVVYQWLDDHRQYISDQWINQVRVYQFADWTASTVGQPVGVEFDGEAVLEGYRLTPS